MYACSTQNTTVQNALCEQFGFSLYRCYISHLFPRNTNLGWRYPGVCGTPYLSHTHTHRVVPRSNQEMARISMCIS